MPIVNPIVPVAEVQTVTVDATGGTFTVTWNGVTTSALAYNVSAADFTTAMGPLTTLAGYCVVTGGPGDAGGTTPYTLTWSSRLGDVEAPTTDAAGLTGGASTAAVATTTAGVDGWDGITLHAGAHTEPAEGTPPSWQWCMTEAAAWMADDPWSDAPASVSPVIAALCNSFNDLLSHESRQDLAAYLDVAPAGIIDSFDAGKETDREWMCVDWLVRTLIVDWLNFIIADPGVVDTTPVSDAATDLAALPALAVGTFDEAATLAALEAAGRAVWDWGAASGFGTFENGGGGGPTWSSMSLPTAYELWGGDWVDRRMALQRGLGVTSTGADNGRSMFADVVLATRQAAWDLATVLVPVEFFTGRSADYAFRRGGDYVAGSAFTLLREIIRVRAEFVGGAWAATSTIEGPPAGGFAELYATAYDNALAFFDFGGTVTSMLGLVDDLCAY